MAILMFVSFLGLELDPFRPGSPGLSLNLDLFGVRGRSREKAGLYLSFLHSFCSVATGWHLTGPKLWMSSTGTNTLLEFYSVNEIAKEEYKMKSPLLVHALVLMSSLLLLWWICR